MSKADDLKYMDISPPAASAGAQLPCGATCDQSAACIDARERATQSSTSLDDYMPLVPNNKHNIATATIVSEAGEEFTGVIRVQDVRATEKDKVKIADCFRGGDVVRGLVVRPLLQGSHCGC